MECAEFCEGIGEARWLIRGNAHPSKNRFDSITGGVRWEGFSTHIRDSFRAIHSNG